MHVYGVVYDDSKWWFIFIKVTHFRIPADLYAYRNQNTTSGRILFDGTWKIAYANVTVFPISEFWSIRQINKFQIRQKTWISGPSLIQIS